jgi:hypothetical protein
MARMLKDDLNKKLRLVVRHNQSSDFMCKQFLAFYMNRALTRGRFFAAVGLNVPPAEGDFNKMTPEMLFEFANGRYNLFKIGEEKYPHLFTPEEKKVTLKHKLKRCIDFVSLDTNYGNAHVYIFPHCIS